jgi:hypothetical protein
MNNLDELIQAFITVIINYYQDQLIGKAKKSDLDWVEVQTLEVLTNPEEISSSSITHPLLNTLRHKTTETLQTELQYLIEQATQEQTTRLTLLNYMLSIITLMHKKIIHNTEIEKSDEDLQNIIIEFFKNIQELFHTQQYATITIFYERNNIQLSGFALSNSKIAAHIHKLLLTPLNIDANTQPNVLHTQIEYLFLKHKINAMACLSQKHKKLIEEHEKLQQEQLLSSQENASLKQAQQDILVSHTHIQQANERLQIERTILIDQLEDHKQSNAQSHAQSNDQISKSSAPKNSRVLLNWLSGPNFARNRHYSLIPIPPVADEDPSDPFGLDSYC